MALLTDVLNLIPALRDRVGEAASPEILRETMTRLDDGAVVAVLTEATAIAGQVEQIRLIAAGLVAARSARRAGHSGLAQTRGHRSPTSLVQEITGTTRAEAARAIRVGESLLDAAGSRSAAADGTGEGISGANGSAGSNGGVGTESTSGGDGRDAAAGSDAKGQVAAGVSVTGPAAREPWHAPLARALTASVITSAQHDAIRRGLGEPPEPAPVGSTDGSGGDADRREALREAAREAWSVAAEQLIAEAPSCTVEELARTARAIRDHLDPEGAHARFLARFEARSFRMWTDAGGAHHGHFQFDDEGALWVRTIIDAVMRPRRGGPRFVDPEEKDRARALLEDPRSNEQLSYDLLIDVLRAGSLADAESVFGTRQAGVRLVQVVDSDRVPAAVSHTEDGLDVLPAAVAEQHTCDTGSRPVTVDPHGNPLDVGREHRLFTSTQRVALAVRDGGCRWPGCDRPASYCEAHHITPWAHGGRSDIDDGLLLCRFHHMNLHHHGWAVTRSSPGDFVLRAPDGAITGLRPPLALVYAWAGAAPPGRRAMRHRAAASTRTREPQLA